MMTGPKLGITVMPEYIQSEGIQSVLERVADRAGAQSVTTSPYVAQEAVPGKGLREPPDDGGAGHGRLLDRPLWGKREVWMDTAPSFRPDPARYHGLAYRPATATALTDAAGHHVGAFLDAASARGLDTWLQVQAAIPPGHRVQFGNPADDDHPRLPNGSTVNGRVDRNASLASPGLRRYMRAFVSDLLATYPNVGGIKFDWPEYPVYTFDALFFDFHPAVASIAKNIGLDLDEVAKGVGAFLSDLSKGGVRHRRIALDDLDSFKASLLANYPALGHMLDLRAAVVSDYARFLREITDEAGSGATKVFLQCFPPPLQTATGFEFRTAGAAAHMVGVKLYTMHWPLIEADYIAALKNRADLDPSLVARTLSRLLQLSPDAPRAPSDIRYPEPGEAHPAATQDLTDKIRASRRDLPTGVGLTAITHGYGPMPDMARRATAAMAGGADEVHVNRYCYLSDEKLDCLGAMVLASA